MDLDTAISSIRTTLKQVEASGEIAEKKTVIEVVPHSETGKLYARKRNGNRFKGCGRAGGIQHREAIRSLQRRELVTKLSSLLRKLEDLKKSEEWQAIAADAMSDTTETLQSQN